MASRSGDRVREREMTGSKSIPQLKVMLTAFFQNASRHSHLRLSVRQQFGLAIMPTVVVLLMVGCVQALRNQPLIFTSLASSAFLVYLDPEHPTNRVRTFLIAQGSAAILGFGSVSLLGTGFLAPGVALVLTIVLIITLDAMHPPAMSTALSFAFHTSSLKTLAIFGLTMVVIASLVALQKAAFWLVQKAGPPPSMYK
jgi:CBS-domain-containing membrane protein